MDTLNDRGKQGIHRPTIFFLKKMKLFQCSNYFSNSVKDKTDFRKHRKHNSKAKLSATCRGQLSQVPVGSEDNKAHIYIANSETLQLRITDQCPRGPQTQAKQNYLTPLCSVQVQWH